MLRDRSWAYSFFPPHLFEVNDRTNPISVLQRGCRASAILFPISTELPAPRGQLPGLLKQLRNLRKSKGYMSRRRAHLKTRAHKVRIGERRKPQPKGHPGYLRVDTVHQGDWDGHKGVYHINAVDQVTQFETVVSVEKISELYLIPALQQLFDILPFEVLGFHSDNGSEYVNYRVSELLEKLRIEFTKSRTRHSNDNALVECKNGMWCGSCSDTHIFLGSVRRN